MPSFWILSEQGWWRWCWHAKLQTLCHHKQGKSRSIECDTFPALLWVCWLDDRKGNRSVKSWVLVYCWWWFDWRFACLIAPTVSTIPVIISSSKIHNADILVPAYPGCPGKRLLNKCCCYFWLLKCKIYRNLFRFAKVVERSLLPHFYEPQFSADYMTYE